MTFILHIMRDLSFNIYTKKKRAVIIRKKEKKLTTFMNNVIIFTEVSTVI